MTYYLVRHGESEWNVRRLTQGQTPHPRLTDVGRDHARAATEILAADLTTREERIERLVTSDLARAVETAEIIGAGLGVVAQPDSRLREQGLGRLEGRGYDETWAVAAEHDWSDPTLPVAGGESVAALHTRIGAVLAEVGSGPTTVLVSHGDAIRAALAQVAGLSPVTAPWVTVPNGAVFRVHADGGWEQLTRGDDRSRS
ncbi:histidine phosphatase family protein [Nocardioides sp. LHG3406-4]|uniref:histidine phosphatase family protein n=1 Tax=Nocardioides sp. LHG3406-4 TaxID=2804575 RepID=UPI003CEAADFA